MFYRWHLCERQKRGALVGKTKRGKGTKLMVLADGAGTPLGIHLAAASPAEVSLVEATLASLPSGGPPERLIGDKGYDSNPLRTWLADNAIEPIIPARSNNRVATHQDGRKLRRYRKRWRVERTLAWLQNFRRMVVRYERRASNFMALVHLACALITLNKVFG